MSITSGTIFNKTRTPLKDWFGAIWYITNQKNGVGALGVHHLLGFGRYQTSWTLLHKSRSPIYNCASQKAQINNVPSKVTIKSCIMHR